MSEKPPTMDAALLARAAAFFSAQPDFLGYWLEVYRERGDVEPAGLARELGCSLETLLQLALCRRPRQDRLYEDTRELAERYGVDQDRLTDLLLDAEVFDSAHSRQAVKERQPQGLPAFAAARDREPDEAVEDPTPLPAGEKGTSDDAG